MSAIITSPLDYFKQVRSQLLAQGISPAESRRRAYEAQQKIFGTPQRQREIFGAPAERIALFSATTSNQLRYRTPKQAYDIARSQALIAGATKQEARRVAQNYSASLPRESFGQFTTQQELTFALSKSPEARAARKQIKIDAQAAGLTQAEAVSLSFAAARVGFGMPLLEGQQALITRLQSQGQSSIQASRDPNALSGQGVGSQTDSGSIGGASSFAGGDLPFFGGGGGDFLGVGEQAGISGGIGLALILGLVAYEMGKGKGGKK